jgi:hypothetical protein
VRVAAPESTGSRNATARSRQSSTARSTDSGDKEAVAPPARRKSSTTAPVAPAAAPKAQPAQPQKQKPQQQQQAKPAAQAGPKQSDIIALETDFGDFDTAFDNGGSTSTAPAPRPGLLDAALANDANPVTDSGPSKSPKRPSGPSYVKRRLRRCAPRRLTTRGRRHRDIMAMFDTMAPPQQPQGAFPFPGGYGAPAPYAAPYGMAPGPQGYAYEPALCARGRGFH